MRGQSWNFGFFSYFAQLTSTVSCFRKYHSKVVKRFSFFGIEESSKIAILATCRYRKWRKIVHFLFARKDQRDNMYQCTLDMLQCMSWCFQSINLRWKSFFTYYIIGRSEHLYRNPWEEGLILANFNTIKSPLVHWIWRRNYNFRKARVL